MPRCAALVPALALALAATACQRGPAFTVEGLPREGDTLAAVAFDSLGLRVQLPEADTATFALDGQPVAAERTAYRTFRLRVDSLADGAHTLAVTVPGGDARAWPFVVDRTPPVLRLDTVEAKGARGPFVVRGTAEGAARVAAAFPGGHALDVVRSGEAFTLTVPAGAPARRVLLTATDAAGNAATRAVALSAGPMRGVHVSSLGWTSATLRGRILDLARAGKINTIQLDIKDEAGVVGYASAVPLATRIGAAKAHYDPRAVLDSLHALGLRVVGRLTVFRDPILGRWAWQNGRADWVVQTAAGQPFGGTYGAYAFTNPYADSVRAYNHALAVEAAGLGFDDVLLDYIRRPEGARSAMRFAGQPQGDSAETAITSFVCESGAAVRARGAGYGVSVFGIAASRPWAVAQDVPALARCVDIVAPMVYASHWGPGEYGVAHPNAMPYEITHRSLLDFKRAVQGTDAQVVAWLQDFSLGVHYDAAKVQAQIRAARDAGTPGFLLWNAGARYTPGGLDE